MRRHPLLSVVFCLFLLSAVAAAVIVWRSGKAKSIYEQGVADVRMGDFQKGETSLKAAAAENPYNADAHYWIGVARQGLDRHGEAVEAFDKALAVDEEIPARGAPAEALPIQRDLAEVWTKRGLSHLALGNYTAAIQDLTKAIASSRNHSMAYCQRGIAYSLEGLPEIARDDLLEALLLDPSDVEALLFHARVSREMGDYLRAIKDARKAIRLRPDSAEGYKIVALGYHTKGDAEAAGRYLEKLAELDPASAAQVKKEMAETPDKGAPVRQGPPGPAAGSTAPGPEPEAPRWPGAQSHLRNG